jgi:uncharacterized protein (DUF1501 family)
MISRRAILGAGLLSGTLGRLGRLSALTAPADDYRALVCVFLFGGNDSNNMVIPLDTERLNLYTTVRKGLALAPDTLLPVEAPSGAPYGLHPKLPELRDLFKSKNLAVVANVGTLLAPTTRDQYQKQAQLPSNLFSHSDQQAAWQSSAAQGSATTGWGGRLADQMAYRNGPSTFPVLLSVAGNALFSVGEHSRPATVIPGSALGLQGYDTSAAAQARYKSLNELLTFDSGAALVQQANLSMKQGLDNASALSDALSGASTLATVFPRTSLGNQLAQIARIIQVRRQLGMTRQIFFASLNGFDTHTVQLTTQDSLYAQVSQALGAFYQATHELGVEGSVTTFTESDFSRTFQPNSSGGTDHAWGSHHLVLGGAVKGGDVYGQFPSLALGGPDDAGSEGRWIPSVATDQYAATMALWFGLSPQLLGSVLPNIGNFPASDVGFMS